MENLNAKKIKKELEGLANFYTCPEYIKNALALINSQEQRIGAQDMTISELRKRVEKAEHDADRYAQRIKELTVDLEAMRGAANSYKMHNKELTAKVKEWEEECDLRGDMWCKLNEENKRLTEKSKNFEQAYDCMHSACLELSDKCDRLTEEKERLLTALANYDRLTDVRIAEEYYTTEAYEELREENENLRTESDRLKARTLEALTEFAESVKRYYSALPGATVGAAVRFYVDEKLKEALDKI